MVFLWIVFQITTLAAMVEVVVASALALSRAGQWTLALRLLDSAAPSPEVRLAAATVAVDCDWFTGSSLTEERLGPLAEDEGWDVDFLRLRHVYRQQLVTGLPNGSELISAADALCASAPDPTRLGWAHMYRGLIADNVVGDRSSAPEHYEQALGTDDPLLTREAQRHLGDHDRDAGDLARARERWEEATALGAGAGAVLGTLSQQMLLAVLARDAGNEAGAVTLAREIARWAGALGAKTIAAQATAFLDGVDPTQVLPASAATAAK
jgi:tetratricopeptide (TPR) repeat protein